MATTTLTTASERIHHNNVHHDNISEHYYVTYENVQHILEDIISPLLCCFGVIGNTLNMLVLTRRRMQTSLDNTMERSVCVGLIALAVSDFFVCLCSLPEAFLSQNVIYSSKSLELFYHMYGMYPRNAFSYSSTWLTVILAMSRYVAIYHPIHARFFVKPGHTCLAIFITFLMWFCLALPEVWNFEVEPLTMNNATHYILDIGSFRKNKSFNRGFVISWSVVGFIIPVSILVFCNVQLIRALQKTYRVNCKAQQGRQGANPRITATLIAIVIMLLILASPSEILSIYYIVDRKTARYDFVLAGIINNLLHTLNFSINFLLYCIANVNFRNTLKDIFCGCSKIQSSEGKSNQSQSANNTSMKTDTTRSSAPECKVCDTVL